jgi:hypothetical protein
MIRARIDLRQAGRLVSAPLVGEDGRAIAWLEIDGAGEVALFGAPQDLRVLAAQAVAAADEAEQLVEVAEQLAAAGIAVRR